MDTAIGAVIFVACLIVVSAGPALIYWLFMFGWNFEFVPLITLARITATWFVIIAGICLFVVITT